MTVDLATGSKIETATDISFSGARGGLELTRTHTTGLAVRGYVGRFGRGMKDNYDVRLTGDFQVGGAGRFVTIEEQDGRLFSFTRTDPDGVLVFTSTATINQLGDEVRRLTDGTFQYRYTDGRALQFDSGRRLTGMIDRNGNTSTLSYSGSNLTRITDAVGRSLTLDYDASNRVTRASDPLGRVW